jgi:D-alanyl-D-alanine carboxypeptidase
MDKTNLIKTLIILAVISGELAVWSFPGEQNPLYDKVIGYTDISISKPLNENNDKNEPVLDNLENHIEDSEAMQEKPGEDTSQIEPKEAENTGLLILVNKSNYLDKSYKPDDLEPIEYFANDRSAESRFMRAEAADQFNKMCLEAKGAGFEIVMTTAYRAYGFQSTLYNNYVSNYGQAEADKFSAKPGHSEHQTGLAVDVTSPTVEYRLTEAFDKTAEWKWLIENADEFGYILRYPKDKSDITGYIYEPWHFRYVGIDAAKFITDEKITLEEYIYK